MFDTENGANDFTIKDIEDFLNGNGDDTPASNNENPQPASNDANTDVTQTQAFAHRLKEATSKARNEEREIVAKELGYESYEEMRKSKEQDLIRNKGFDPEEVSPIIDELVKKRLASDPRMQELEQLRQKQMEDWAKKELSDLSTLTNGLVKTLDDVPANVIELWKKKGSLKSAYMELEGENLLRNMQAQYRGAATRGGTGHMQSPQGSPAPVTPTGNQKRKYTQNEKDIYRLFNPDITDEELDKLEKDI